MFQGLADGWNCLPEIQPNSFTAYLSLLDREVSLELSLTSLAAGLGMLPLAYGVGSGADMLRPLAIAVIGALCISVLLSLVATPVLYRVLAGHASRP